MVIEREEFEWLVKTISFLISEFGGDISMFPTRNRLEALEKKYKGAQGMKVEMDDTKISIGFEDKSEYKKTFHTLSFFGEDSGEIVIYLSDKELQNLKEKLE